ncbi:MAG: hypothetical protein K2N73_08775 [Lachnospiraceae bacterium]|nr:hypothetical protein [Lachnospiraceae bacterium]
MTIGKRKIYLTGMMLVMAAMLTACGEKQDLDAAKVLPETETQERISYEGMVSEPVVCEQKNTYDTLNVATYITKIDDTYFIADCYHDQIIYHDNITDPLTEWSVLTNEVHYAHTIASDGTLILVDDTENNRLMAFQKKDDGYVHTQKLENIGMRPHYVQYDEINHVFMAWSSITGEMYLIKRTEQADANGIYPLYVDKVLKIGELYGVYVRSFTVLEDGIYFVSGHNNQKIVKAVINDAGDGFDITQEYPVADGIAGMVQLTKIDDFYYITVSTDNLENQEYATIIRTDSLEKLSSGEYEDIYGQFGLSQGTPYYITEIEGRYYMAHHRTSENIVAFDVNGSRIENVAVIY